MNFRQRISIWILIIALLSAISAWRFSKEVSLQADILSAIPGAAYPENITQLLEQQARNLQYNVEFLVGASNESDSRLISHTLKNELSSLIAFNISPKNKNKMFLTFFSTGHFLTPEQHLQLTLKQDSALISDAYGALTMPGNNLANEAVTTDPLFISLNYIRHISQSMGLNLTETQPIRADGRIYQQLTGTLKSVDNVTQITQINAHINRLMQQYEYANINIIRSGFSFHSAAAEQQAKHEISSYGLMALIGVIFMVIAVFRSPFPLFLSILGVSSSILTGLTATLCLFDEIHILTFVFAVSLVGISIDYIFHFFAHRSGPQEDDVLFRRALSASLITSISGYALLTIAPLPLLKQVAIFMIFGLLGAYLFVRFVVSYHTWQQAEMSYIARRAVNVYSHPFRLLAISKTRLLLLSLSALVLGLFALTLQQKNLFKDDIRLLITPSAALTEEEIKYRQLTQHQWDSGFLLVTAPNEQALLENTHALDQQLNTAVQNHQIGAYLALPSWLPNADRQYENQKLIHSFLANSATQEYLSLFDYSLETARTLYSGKQAISLADIQEQLPVSGAQQLLLYGSETIAAIYLLKHVNDWPLITKLATQQPHVLLIDKPQDISFTLSHIRTSILYLLSGMLLIAMIYLSLMFNAKDALYAVTLVALAITVSFFSSYLWMGYLNIFNLFASLLIIALGLDYIIFYLSPLRDDRVRLAILLSSVSTLLGFGLLSFSSTPAVASFGSGVMSGIVALMFFTPTIRFLWRL